MIVEVKLMGVLKAHAPTTGQVELAAGETIDHVLKKLDVPATGVQICTVNGSLERDRERELQDGDVLTILPPAGGG